MPEPRRIYLDNAATSWPKPPEMLRALEDYYKRLGAAAGRGASSEAGEVDGVIRNARAGVARLLGVVDPKRIVFTFNGTDSLNQVLFGLLQKPDSGQPRHVVTTVCEHNSVLRPLRALSEAGAIDVDYVGCDADGLVSAADIAAAIRAETALVAVVHASNVTGAIQPVREIAALVRKNHSRLLLDAAQTLGHLPIDVAELDCDFLAAPGHKGLLGPLGTGVLFVRPGLESELQPLRMGGTGTRSEDDRQPEGMPDRFESGNHNAGGLYALAASVQFLRQRGIQQLRDHEMQLTARLWTGLAELQDVHLHGPRDAHSRCGVVSMTLTGFAPQEVAAMLDAGCRIQVRAGLHCAPKMHEALGTLTTGGTVRFSVGQFNTEEDIDAAIAAVAELTG